MLSRLNEFFQGWISVLIISVVSLTFVLWGLDSYLHNASRNQAVARVAKVEITKDELHRNFERSRAQYEQVAGKPIVDEQEIRTLRNQTLDSMITRQALQLDAENAGFYVSPKQAEASLFSLPVFQEDGKFSPERFQRALSGLQYTQGEFVADLQSEMSVNQIRAGLVLSSFATPEDIEQTIRLVEQKRNIEYMIIDAQSFPTVVSPAEIKAYYDKHQTEFKSPDQVKIAYISLSMEELVKNTQVSPAEVQQFYQSNMSNYLTPAKWRIAHINIKLPENATAAQIQTAKEKAEKIAAKIKNGADFAATAKTNSDDAITKNQGGEMPELTRGAMDPSFDAVFTKLTKPGEISAPVQTKYGFELIKLLAYTKEVTTPLASVQDKIAQNLKQEKAQKTFGDLREELANQTFSNPTTLESASKALKLPLQNTDYFSKLQHGKDITANPQVLRAAFSDDVMNQGNNSDVIALNETNAIVLRVVEHKPAAVQPQAAVSKLIEEKLGLQARIKESYKLATVLQDPKSTPAEVQNIVSSHHLKWVSEKEVMRKAPKLPAAILDAAFSLSQKNKTDKPTKLVTLNDKGTAIVKLIDVIPGVLQTLNDQQKVTLRDEVASSHGQLAYEIYKDEVVKKTKIEHIEVATATEGEQ